MVFGLGQALARSAVAIYTIVLIRLLPEADYGDFAFAFSLETSIRKFVIPFLRADCQIGPILLSLHCCNSVLIALFLPRL